MAHPLVPEIWQSAEQVAPSLGLEVIEVVLYTHKSPPIVRIDVRNLTEHTGLDDCERMTLALSASLDELIPFAYVLEVSSPGTSRQLVTDREFRAFRGFQVVVKGASKEWLGQLVERTADMVIITQKGKRLEIPISDIHQVELH